MAQFKPIQYVINWVNLQVLEIQQNPTIEQAPEQAAVKAKFVIVKV